MKKASSAWKNTSSSRNPARFSRSIPAFSTTITPSISCRTPSRPLLDGKVKPEELTRSVEAQLDNFFSMNSQPTAVLTKASDALPAIGIVAAVLGIVITMASIAGDKAEIGEHVAHALVGTFLGLLLSYGFAQPLINRIETIHEEEISYLAVIGRMVISYALGAPPMTAAEAGRADHPRPPSAEL